MYAIKYDVCKVCLQMGEKQNDDLNINAQRDELRNEIVINKDLTNHYLIRYI